MGNWWTALHHAIDRIDELLSYVAVDIYEKIYKKKSLHFAALAGRMNICKMLIEKKKFDVHMTDDEGCTALHNSVLSGSYKLFLYFIDMETDINLKIKDGKNCLHLAALSGNLKLCKLLVEKYEFDVNMADYHGWTALHCSVHNGSYKLVT